MNLAENSKSNKHARPRPFTFYPPKRNRCVTFLIKLWIRGEIRRKLRVTEIEILDDGLERLEKLKGKRCLKILKNRS